MHIVDNIVKFPDNDDGIYFSKHNKVLFRKLCEDNKSNMIEGLNNLKNVGGNNKGISKSQYKRAPVARKIYHIVGAPDLQILRMIIIQNIINNFPVTVGDIEIVEKIFGPYVSTLKGKTMRQSQKLVEDDFIEIPR